MIFKRPCSVQRVELKKNGIKLSYILKALAVFETKIKQIVSHAVTQRTVLGSIVFFKGYFWSTLRMIFFQVFWKK